MIKHNLVIIGGGSAGLSAALGAYEEGERDILILERTEMLGGILNQCVHNGFGLTEFKEELTGPEFAYRFIEKIKEKDIDYRLNSFVLNISQDKVVSYCNEEEGFVKVQAKAIIMAAGCYERNAGTIALPGDRPAGVLTAGQAQLLLNEEGYLVGKRVFILGSGDIGLIMARRLTLEGAKVLGVAELCSYSNGLNRNIVQCLNDYNIPLLLSHTVTKCIGKSRLEKIELSEVDVNGQVIPGTGQEIECDSLILSVGLLPNNGLLNTLGIPVGRSRGSLVNSHFETLKEGIFSCGNVLHVHDLADYVVEEARNAGKWAAKYIKEGEYVAPSVNVSAGDGIGYVVPGIALLADEPIAFKFRVRKPAKDVYICYEQNGKIVKKVYKPVIIPSEMEVQRVPASTFEKEGDIIISLKEKGALQ